MGFEVPIDSDYPDHRKTKALIARLRDPNADIYPLRLWLWASKYCRSGVIKGGARELEGAVRWSGAPLKLFRSMKAVGFVDSISSGRLVIHGWSEGIGRQLLAYDIKKFNQRKAYSEKHGIPFTESAPTLGILPEETGRIPLSHPIPSNPIQSHPIRDNEDGAPAEGGYDKPPVLRSGSPEAYLIEIWNRASKGWPISFERGGKFVSVALGAEVPALKIEQVFHDTKTCAGRKIWSVLEELLPSDADRQKNELMAWAKRMDATGGGNGAH